MGEIIEANAFYFPPRWQVTQKCASQLDKEKLNKL